MVKIVNSDCAFYRRFAGGPYKMPPMPALTRSKISEA